MQETEVVRPFEEIRNMYLDEIDIFTEEGMQVDKSFSIEHNLLPLFPNYLSMIMVIT